MKRPEPATVKRSLKVEVPIATKPSEFLTMKEEVEPISEMAKTGRLSSSYRLPEVWLLVVY